MNTTHICEALKDPFMCHVTLSPAYRDTYMPCNMTHIHACDVKNSHMQNDSYTHVT